MDEYTDEQCAQLREYERKMLQELAGVEPMRAMIQIQDALRLVGDHELIVDFLAGEYGAQAFYCKIKYGTKLSHELFDAFWKHAYDPWEDDDYKHSVWLTCAEAYRQTEDYWEQEQKPQRGYSVRGYDWEYK
tara:strand:- start:6342 stop:6737 length:396 start_codon:yes stop_codon:yes gene_type:complete